MVIYQEDILKTLCLGDVPIKKMFLGEQTVYKKQNYITLTQYGSLSSVTFSKISSTHSIEYSYDLNTWTPATEGQSLTLRNIIPQNSPVVFLRGILSGTQTSSDYTNIEISSTFHSGDVRITGDINALYNYTDLDTFAKEYYCFSLFANSNDLTSVDFPLVIQTNTAGDAPKESYEGAFAIMFYDCVNLINVPQLPSTILDNYCYYGMFYGCTSLDTAPELPSTTLAEGCYSGMFRGCTGLTSAPELPASTLVNSCYASMFSDCTNLQNVKCLATDISATSCTNFWLSNVAATGVFIKSSIMNDWTRGISGIPTGWTVVDLS